jgi:hypothetical protein
MRTERRLWAFPLFRILFPSGYGCVGVSSPRLHFQAWLLTCELGTGHRYEGERQRLTSVTYRRCQP